MTEGAISRGVFASRIHDAWARAVQSVFDVGRELMDAKAALEHGAFEAMMADDLPFSASTARRLMAIAADPRLTQNVHSVHDLPASWGTLYELTKLGDADFEKASAEGRITPDMTRADVARLRTPPPVEAARPGPEVAAELDALAAGEVKFAAILADPPWKFKNWSEKGGGRGPDYPTMEVEEICALPVGDLAADDCVLFLWVTSPFLERAFEVMAAWGFEYKTVAFTWVKRESKGSGYHRGKGKWTRSNPEICLLGTKGSPARRTRDVDQLVMAPVAEHSRKPDAVSDAIERLVAGPYLEMFARRTRPGWTVWGNQVEAAA